MKRIEYTEFGGADVMNIKDTILPKITDTQVRIQVKASSVNEIDWFLRRGYMQPQTGVSFPKGMGKDFAGIVIEAGSNQPYKVGDEVFGGKTLEDQGAFAEEIIVDAKDVIKKPENVSFSHIATLPVVGGTAWQALVANAGIKQGDTVFINGAYGSMGQVAVQLAKEFGAASIIARVSPDDFEAVKAIGATEAISYADPVPSNFDQSFDIVFDTHGSLATADQTRLVKPEGVILDVVPSDEKVALASEDSRRKIVFGSVESPVLQELAQLAEAEKLSIHIGQEVSLDDAPKVIAALENGTKVKGKTVIVLN